MKIFYTIILVLFTVGLYAQNQPMNHYIQSKEKGIVSFQQSLIKSPSKISKTKKLCVKCCIHYKFNTVLILRGI